MTDLQPDPQMWRWFDHTGGIIETPVTDRPPTCFGTYDRLNHWMFGEPSEQLRHQAMTLCGKQAHEIPGRGGVDCPECIEIVLENEGDPRAA